MTDNDIRKYTDYLANQNIFQNAEIDVKQFMYKMVSRLYNIAIDEKSMQTIEMQTERFMNWYFSCFGINTRDIETISYDVKLKLFTRFTSILKTRGSNDTVNHYINIILAMGINVDVYYVNIVKDSLGVKYEFVPHQNNKRRTPANTTQIKDFLFKHRDSLKEYEKSNIFPIRTNIIYYDYTGLNDYGKYPDWMVDTWIKLHSDKNKSVYFLTESSGITIDAEDIVDVVYYMKFHQRTELTGSGARDRWLLFDKLKDGKEDEFNYYFELLGTTDFYTRKVNSIRENILKLFEKDDGSNSFDYLEEKYPKLKSVLGVKLSQNELFDMMTVLSGQDFLVVNKSPTVKERWIKYIIGSIIEFNDLWKVVVEPLKNLFQIYFLPVYTESISNTNYIFVAKSVFQNMFMDDLVKSNMDIDHVDRHLTNMKSLIQFKVVASDKRYGLDTFTSEMLSRLKTKLVVVDDFEFINMFYEKEHQFDDKYELLMGFSDKNENVFTSKYDVYPITTMFEENVFSERQTMLLMKYEKTNATAFDQTIMEIFTKHKDSFRIPTILNTSIQTELKEQLRYDDNYTTEVKS